MRISVVIITYNEEKHIERCLRSVGKVADEIVVLDSISADRTVEIARRYGAVVYSQPFAGYVAQKNRALELATNDYVLCLDADEALSEELAESILRMKEQDKAGTWKMNRRAFYCGAYITHGAWYPEPKLRLFDRRRMKWGGYDPHDRVIPPAGVNVGKMKGDLLHYICETVEEHERRSRNFSTIASRSLYKAGIKTNWLKMIGSPAWFFISDYVFRGGFLGGWRGWKIATIQTKYHFEKYRKLYRLHKQQDLNKPV
ncbi:MAG: glycosyltransferase family 2 protein [Chitinophagaceae bacterium]|nr:MAG: glycosyltransferase family 2 protein [Chitinophagaceae bacterium]